MRAWVVCLFAETRGASNYYDQASQARGKLMDDEHVSMFGKYASPLPLSLTHTYAHSRARTHSATLAAPQNGTQHKHAPRSAPAMLVPKPPGAMLEP